MKFTYTAIGYTSKGSTMRTTVKANDQFQALGLARKMIPEQFTSIEIKYARRKP